VIYEVVTEMSIKCTVLWDVTPYRLVDGTAVYENPLLASSGYKKMRWRQRVYPKRRHPSTKLKDVTCHNHRNLDNTEIWAPSRVASTVRYSPDFPLAGTEENHEYSVRIADIVTETEPGSSPIQI
jgi:hypothetical protein